MLLKEEFVGYDEQNQADEQKENRISSTKLSIIEDSRDIPQLLSDQASRYAPSSKTMAKAGSQYFGRAKRDDESVCSSLYALSSMPTEHGLGHIRKDRDYKPHDHLNVEESPQAKGLEHLLRKEQNSKPLFLSQFQKDSKAKQSVDLIESLITQIQRKKNLGDGYFVYLRQKNPKNPYELLPFGFNGDQIELGSSVEVSPPRDGNKSSTSRYHQSTDGKMSQVAKYYTLSKKGMTTFVQSEPTEFTRIESWLAERAIFRQISQLKFFKKFKSWKVLKMWRRNILTARREEVTANLRGRLFMGDPVFGKILMQHRQACKDLEKLRVLDFQ